MQNKTKPRDLQDVFNRVWRHFIIEQNGESKSITGRCAYRGYDTQNAPACAVGCMLPNELAKKGDGCEDADISNVIDSVPSIAEWFSNVAMRDLADLQFIHDNCFGDMKGQLERFADRKDLLIPQG